MNLRITNQPRQDYPFKGCKTIEDNTDSSEVVKCSPLEKNYKIPNKEEEQTVACFKKEVVKCSPVKKNYKIPNKKEEQTVACFKKVVFCDSV